MNQRIVEAVAEVGSACYRERAALRDEVARLRAQLAVSTRGLRHCAGWNIREDKRNALMAVVFESEALLSKPAP